MPLEGHLHIDAEGRLSRALSLGAPDGELEDGTPFWAVDAGELAPTISSLPAVLGYCLNLVPAAGYQAFDHHLWQYRYVYQAPSVEGAEP